MSIVVRSRPANRRTPASSPDSRAEHASPAASLDCLVFAASSLVEGDTRALTKESVLRSKNKRVVRQPLTVKVESRRRLPESISLRFPRFAALLIRWLQHL